MGKLTVSIYGMRGTIAAPFRARLEQSTHVVYQALEIRSGGGGIEILPPKTALEVVLRDFTSNFLTRIEVELEILRRIINTHFHTGTENLRHRSF